MDRRILIFLLMLIIGMQLPRCYAQEAPMDVASIELLISKHKKQYDKLQERNQEITKRNAIGALVKDITSKYERLHKDLMNKYSLATQWFNLGLNTISIVTELNELRKALPPFLENINKITNPNVLLKYMRVMRQIRAEIDLCIKVAASIPALRLNASELDEIATLIKEHIYRVKYYIKIYSMQISGQALYNDMFEKPSLPDYARVANEVIKEYYGGTEK